jgi:uncharacterized DUF497 family protein
MMFEWDENKAESNRIKHDVSFPFAVRAFDDQNRVTVIDNRRDYGEMRYVTLAKIGDRVYVVAYTYRLARIRLISARKANTKEVNHYDNR